MTGGEILIRPLQVHRRQVKIKTSGKFVAEANCTCLRDRPNRLIRTSGVDRLDKMGKEVGRSSCFYAVRPERMYGPVRMGSNELYSCARVCDEREGED